MAPLPTRRKCVWGGRGVRGGVPVAPRLTASVRPDVRCTGCAPIRPHVRMHVMALCCPPPPHPPPCLLAVASASDGHPVSDSLEAPVREVKWESGMALSSSLLLSACALWVVGVCVCGLGLVPLPYSKRACVGFASRRLPLHPVRVSWHPLPHSLLPPILLPTLLQPLPRHNLPPPCTTHHTPPLPCFFSRSTNCVGPQASGCRGVWAAPARCCPPRASRAHFPQRCWDCPPGCRPCQHRPRVAVAAAVEVAVAAAVEVAVAAAVEAAAAMVVLGWCLC